MRDEFVRMLRSLPPGLRERVVFEFVSEMNYEDDRTELVTALLEAYRAATRANHPGSLLLLVTAVLVWWSPDDGIRFAELAVRTFDGESADPSVVRALGAVWVELERFGYERDRR